MCRDPTLAQPHGRFAFLVGKIVKAYTLVLREVADINSASAILPEVPLPGVHGGPVRLFILDDNQIVHRHFRYDDRLLSIRNRVVHWQIQPADEVREMRMAADGLRCGFSVKWA